MDVYRAGYLIRANLLYALAYIQIQEFRKELEFPKYFQVQELRLGNGAGGSNYESF